MTKTQGKQAKRKGSVLSCPASSFRAFPLNFSAGSTVPITSPLLPHGKVTVFIIALDSVCQM